MKKIIVFMITTIIWLIPFQQVVLANIEEADIEDDPFLGYFLSRKQYEEKYNETSYLWPRVRVGDKAELPNREELDENEFVLYWCNFGFSFGIGLKNIEEILDTNIEDYYFGSLETNGVYYEMNKKRPIIDSDATIGTGEFWRIYRAGNYPMSIAIIDDYVREFIFDEDVVKNKVSSKIQIQDRYVFHNYNYIGGHDYWVYYKTNMGDYVYVLEHYAGEIYRGERYLYPVEEFKYYQKALVEKMKKVLRGEETSADGGANEDKYDMSVFNVDSPEFNIKAKASDIIGPIGSQHNYLYYILGAVVIGGVVGIIVFKKISRNKNRTT